MTPSSGSQLEEVLKDYGNYVFKEKSSKREDFSKKKTETAALTVFG